MINEQVLDQNTHATEVDNHLGEDIGESSFGKFKDASSLLKAYNSLQSEFTKRCQRIKELESKQVSEKHDNEIKDQPKGITDKEKEEVLKDYLKEVLNSKSKAIVLDGAGIGLSVPPQKPKTVQEAGILAKELFNK